MDVLLVMVCYLNETAVKYQNDMGPMVFHKKKTNNTLFFF